MEGPFFRSGFNYDRNAASDESGLDTGSEGGAKQSFKDECDINTIVKRFGLTGELPSNVRTPVNGDFLNVPDFQTAMGIIRSAQEAFAEMPSAVRSRFHNDPAEFMDFVSDASNRAEAEKLGLVLPPAAPEPAPEPVAVRVVSDGVDKVA